MEPGTTKYQGIKLLIYNLEQNICNKVKKLSKTRQEEETLIFTIAQF